MDLDPSGDGSDRMSIDAPSDLDIEMRSASDPDVVMDSPTDSAVGSDGDESDDEGPATEPDELPLPPRPSSDHEYEEIAQYPLPEGEASPPDDADLVEVNTTAGVLWATREERSEFIEAHVQYVVDWYDEWEPPDNPALELYQPRGRLHTNRLLYYEIWDLFYFEDFYYRMGVPHQVLMPSGEWLPFQTWMLRVARGWWKQVDQPPVSPSAFGSHYNVGQINFFRVMRSRIDRNVKYAVFTRFARRRQWEGICKWDDPVSRQRSIMFSLTGEGARVVDDPTSDEVASLLRFIRSDIVRLPWYEYWNGYLKHNPWTSNPAWSMIQKSLHNDALADHRRRAYGKGDLSVHEELDKSNWSHEDHAIRFIISVYYPMKAYVHSGGHDSSDVPAGWRACAYKTENRPDIDDRYWFGFSLLMLLTLSWQHHSKFPSKKYHDRLVPALYYDFKTGRKMRFPRHKVGQIDLSPFTPWEIDEPYVSRFDFEGARSLGQIGEGEGEDLFERESTTELGDNGNRLPDESPRDTGLI
ncbi:hypothetical protein F5B19DRAFT_248253 [Rostrohypoxylon terebratum]|nr:hypothetical protein F5B19DRAFT_248253 [Rostrohypoxylon terebratum]